jgi:hypothetical protein
MIHLMRYTTMKALGVKWEPFRQRLTQNDVGMLDRCRIHFTLAANFKEYFEAGKKAVYAAPGDPKFRAYKAAFRALEAKYAVWPHDKLLHVQQSLSQLDSLVSLRPEDVEIRFLRAMIAERLPAMFNRKAQALSDIEYVLAHLSGLQEPEFEAFVLEYLSSEVQLPEKLKRTVSELKAGYNPESAL